MLTGMGTNKTGMEDRESVENQGDSAPNQTQDHAAADQPMIAVQL